MKGDNLMQGLNEIDEEEYDKKLPQIKALDNYDNLVGEINRKKSLIVIPNG